MVGNTLPRWLLPFYSSLSHARTLCSATAPHQGVVTAAWLACFISHIATPRYIVGSHGVLPSGYIVNSAGAITLSEMAEDMSSLPLRVIGNVMARR